MSIKQQVVEYITDMLGRTPWPDQIHHAVRLVNQLQEPATLNPMSEPPEGKYKERWVLVVGKLGTGEIAGKPMKLSEGWYSHTLNKWMEPRNAESAAGWIEVPQVKL